MKSTLTLLVAAAALTPGCLITGLSSDDTDEGAASQVLQECREDHDVDDATQIVADFDQSIHEMVACGGLSVTLCASVVTGIIDAIIDNRSDATPPEWTYEGDGRYTSDAAGAGMVTQFYFSSDYSFAQAGDRVTENLFEVSTYLTGARIELVLDPNNPLASTTRLHFDAAGPYIELLGFGAEPQSPINLTLDAWDQAQAQLGTLAFESDVTVDDPQDDTTVRYEVHTTRMPAAALLNASPMQYELIRADANRADLGQDLVVDDWGVEFVNGSGGALEGVIDFHVEGGPLPYNGALVYENATFAEIELSCP